MSNEQFPMRINKYLAHKGICTRRQADDWIAQGRVMVGGEPAVIGQQIQAEDEVVVRSKDLAKAASDRVYFAFNKPIGLATEDVLEKLVPTLPKKAKDVFPVGRLDKVSHGLLVLTNDGRVTDRLLNPKYVHDKEYVVRTDKPITQNFLTRMGKGVKLEDGYITKTAMLAGEVGAKRFSIILTEGRKHQIRRMCTVLGFAVKDLRRVRVMNLKLSGLEPGEYREVIGKELKVFLKSLGMVK